MNRILKIGMDVHSTNYTLCAMEPVISAEDRIFANIKETPDYKNILMFIENLKQKLGLNDTYDIECGYEAILCTMSLLPQGSNVSYLHQQPCLRSRDSGLRRMRSMRSVSDTGIIMWTIAHLKWLKQLDVSALYRETLDEYMATYDEQTGKIERFYKRIEELASRERYQKKVGKLGCFLGIKTHTALSLIVETGDFERFAKGIVYAAYFGLAPGEKSSSDINRLGITKAGNRHLRQLLIEAAGGICKGAVG